MDDNDTNNVNLHTHRNISKLIVDINGLSGTKKEIDYKSFRPNFAWKPITVIRHTLENTTRVRGLTIHKLLLQILLVNYVLF